MIEKIKPIIPVTVFDELQIVIDKFNLSTPFRLAHFLGQCHHESGGFRITQENLSYSSDRLLLIFPKYFKNIDTTPFNRNPIKIANKVYSNRMGNGDELSGDGYKFHGRGFIQLTGRINYTSFTNAIGEDVITNPDLVATKYPLTSAAWFFTTNNLQKIADKGSDDSVVEEITKRINGGVIGLAERTIQFKKYYELLK